MRRLAQGLSRLSFCCELSLLLCKAPEATQLQSP